MTDSTRKQLEANEEQAADATLAPEAHNEEQDDEGAQAQTLADEALGRATSVFGANDESDHAEGDDDDSGSTPDLVDHMKQMVSSGRIDMGAFRGERSDDDEDGALGESGMEDDFPHGAE
ncbi:hypothetical protein [Novosphingobium lentum]|uniref:hypothetical protein n=1 Tax=Novosphingobium lentum TaxID=145287 RepID=UPI0008365543|nr:hypothetical protein [Novosphingobium lentum]